jgi:hypothetical protein
MTERQEQQVLIDRIRHNQGRKESLLKELEKSLDLDALPEEVFEHGKCKVVWEGAVNGTYKRGLTIFQMRDPKIHHRARIQRGVSDGFFVDEILINEEDMPISILPEVRQLLRMQGATRNLRRTEP